MSDDLNKVHKSARQNLVRRFKKLALDLGLPNELHLRGTEERHGIEKVVSICFKTVSCNLLKTDANKFHTKTFKVFTT